MRIIGLMSGTSLDGLDIAYCDIVGEEGGGMDVRLLAADTVAYPKEWVGCLSSLEHASAYDYALAHVRLGHYFGQQVNLFRKRHPGAVDAVASHGHTVFHQPHLGLTAQIGDGDAIAAETGLPVVFNFRTYDVALGGQGAPLVPIGDRLLFGNYDACLNLGGFCNISFEHDGRRVAFDISPCNMALNNLAGRAGQPFDRDGALARAGKVDVEMLSRLDSLDYYRRSWPKSLGKEWFVSSFLPLLEGSTSSTEDKLRTVVEHIARQVASAASSAGSLLLTGGGARNRFLVERIAALLPHCRTTVPDEAMVDYKEAVIFAVLGYLRLTERQNCLCSVTGARADSCGGNISGVSGRV